MTKKLAFLVFCLIALPNLGLAASCSRINLTRCLDSACAINLSANPAARCQYCGTTEAGAPAASALKSVTAGSASKSSISAKELKQAPDDPGERYVWATKLCLQKIQNCTTEDVEEAYDPLIEKSCTAAGISQNMADLQKKANKNKKTASGCTDDINNCMIASNKCGPDFSKCKDQEQFDKFFAACSAQATGCSAFINDARTKIAATRDSTQSTISTNITNIVASYIRKRIDKFTSVNNGCKNNTNFNTCVETVCQNNTADNCATANTKSIAVNLCEFHKTACKKVQIKSDKEMQQELDKLLEANMK